MHHVYVPPLPELLSSSAGHCRLDCEEALRFSTSTLFHSPADEITLTTVVGAIGAGMCALPTDRSPSDSLARVWLVDSSKLVVVD